MTFETHEPVYFVRVKPSEGGDERVDLTDRVQRFEYEDNESAADKLSLTVDNWDLANFDDPVWKKGNILEVSWGYPGVMAPIRTVQIRSVKGFEVLTIEAHGKEVLANRVVKTRVFENMRRSDVVRQIAEELGYISDDVLHIQDTEIVYETISQSRLTDAQFIRRLAHKEGFLWFIDYDGFHFHERDVAQAPIRTYTYYNIGHTGSNIESIQIKNDVTAKPGRVKRKGRDPLNRKDVDGEADNDSDTKRGVTSEKIEVIDPETGDSLGFKEIGQEDTKPTSEESDAAARREAAGRFRNVQQVAVKLSLTVRGDPTILAKTVFELANVGKRLSQRYYIRKAVHTVEAGYIVRIDAVSDGTGGHSTKSTFASGLSGIQVGPAAKGKRAPKDVVNNTATAIIQAGQYAETYGLTPPALTPKVINGKTIFVDTKGRRIPEQVAIQQAKAELIRIKSQAAAQAAGATPTERINPETGESY